MPPISIRGFRTHQKLYKLGHRPGQWWGPGASTEGVNIFAARLRVAKAFRGIMLEDYKENTVLGYNGLFRVVLTYSALEQFMAMEKVNTPSRLEAALLPYDPGTVLALLRRKDRKDLFWDFILQRTSSKMLRSRLTEIKAGSSHNIAVIAAAIRHIFAHGHLTANAQGIKPQNVHAICQGISEFLIDFMEAEMEKRIEVYCKRENIKV